MNIILYIEDEPRVAELVQRRLERMGYCILLARNSIEADLKIAEKRPDLILLDIGLGEIGIDGWEIQEKLKEHPNTNQIPVIALTAQNPTEDDRNEALKRGFTDHVPKPIEWDILEVAIANALAMKRGNP